MDRGQPFVFPAARALERGLPGIGFRLQPPAEAMLCAIDPPGAGGAVLRLEERGAEGHLIGWIEIGLFGAALLIDRAGVLRDAARHAAEAALVGPSRARLLGEGEVEFAGGASGFRVDLLLQLDDEGRLRPECPYGSWIALAGADVVVGGGVSALVRSAGPSWPHATSALDSLEIAGSPDAGGARIDLPLVG
ncbi:MAG TPA: hypothetical protein VKB80_37015 [Kofleriaceae bacterium]|nr:hypothetical protein [Kofleriaceae bacterium]